MSVITGFFAYLAANSSQIFNLLLEHIRLTAIAVGVSILIGVPLGIFICYIRKASKPILGLANIIQAVPSMALLGFAIPLLGIGTLPAVVVVVLYSLLPIIKNTDAGIQGINPDTIAAAAAWATWFSPASAPWITIRSWLAPSPPACWRCWWTSSLASWKNWSRL